MIRAYKYLSETELSEIPFPNTLKDENEKIRNTLWTINNFSEEKIKNIYNLKFYEWPEIPQSKILKEEKIQFINGNFEFIQILEDKPDLPEISDLIENAKKVYRKEKIQKLADIIINDCNQYKSYPSKFALLRELSKTIPKEI